MPDFMHIVAVDPVPPVNDPPEPGDDDLVCEDIQAIVERAARDAPGFDFTVVYDGTREWIDIHVWLVRGGKAEQAPLQLSRDPEVCNASSAEPAPEVVLPIDVDGDELIDLVDRAAGEHGESGEATGGRELVLPFRYEDEGLLLEAASVVAKHLLADRVELLVQVEDRFYELRLSRGRGAELVPLWPWLTDPTARALVRRVLDPPGAVRSLACSPEAPARSTKRRDGAPLTSGSIRARINAAEAIKPKGAYPQLLAAWTARENQDPRADGIRQVLVGKLIAADATCAVDVLCSSLRSERDAVRETIYDAFSRVESQTASRALVEGYRVETGAVRELVGEVLWRREATVEVLVREGLVSAWRADPKHAKRILRLLKEECLPIRRAWLAPAAPELFDAAASLITD